MNAVNDHPSATCDVDALNTLLRDQLAAVETYDRAMSKFEDHHVLADLQQIREEHARAMVQLRDKVIQFGGEPCEASGPWDACAAAIAGPAQIIGPATALAALRQGEEHAINEFDDVLKNDNVNPECKNLIRADLLPRGRNHVEDLNRLMGGM